MEYKIGDLILVNSQLECWQYNRKIAKIVYILINNEYPYVITMKDKSTRLNKSEMILLNKISKILFE